MRPGEGTSPTAALRAEVATSALSYSADSCADPIGLFRSYPQTSSGGGQGYLLDTRSLCDFPPTSSVEIDPHNGKTVIEQVKHKRLKCHASSATITASLSGEHSASRESGTLPPLRPAATNLEETNEAEKEGAGDG